MKRFPVACWPWSWSMRLSAEWLGSVAGITGATCSGMFSPVPNIKADVERSFYALGHGLSDSSIFRFHRPFQRLSSACRVTGC